MTATAKHIWYNPATASFEGRVDVRRDGTAFRYPCRVPGDPSLSPSDVRARMERQALSMSDS